MIPETNATDWSTSYSQYLARSAALSARTLSLYQIALERISQGKLPATIFQDHFPRFAASHSAEFTARLSEVVSRFLSGLVKLGVNLAQSSPSEGAEAEREIVPPHFDSSDPIRWYEQLADYAGQLNARALKAYRLQLDRVASGEMTPGEVQQQAAEQATRQLPGYMQSMTRLYFDLLNGLNDVRSAYEETYFRGLFAATKPDESDPSVAITLAGPAGSTAAASLSITNTTGRRTRIGHRIFDVRRVDGAGPSLVPALVFSPENLDLGPDEEGTLNLSVQLDEARYDAGALYSGKLHLTGGSDVPLEVELRILATAAAQDRVNGQPTA